MTHTKYKRTDSLREDYFDTWSENMAWLFGYLCADGSLTKKHHSYRLGFSCSKCDVGMLIDIKRELRCESAIREIRARSFGNQPICAFDVRSRRLGEKLISLGAHTKKRGLDRPFPNVPDEFLNHFTRGIIDANGTIGSYKRPNGQLRVIRLLGGRRVVSGLADGISRLLQIEPKAIRIQACEKLVATDYTSKTDLNKLIDWLYPPGQYLNLERKAERAKSILAEISGKGD